MKITEIFSVSTSSLKTNKLRTFLTILGVVVGIFSIIVIMTIISMLQATIQDSVAMLNKNTFRIQKFPQIQTGGHEAWLRYRNRKDITVDEYYRFESLMPNVKYIGAILAANGKIIKFNNKETNPNINVIGGTVGAFYTYNVGLQKGREIRQFDIDYSNHVCIIGMDVVEKLFGNIDPLGQMIRVDGDPMEVIGVMEKQPELFGESMDNLVIIPLSTFLSYYGKKDQSVDITVMTYSKEDYQPAIEAAIGFMRTIRKVLPGKENDFDIFSNESVIAQINDITENIRIGAMAVSFIALIAAGVGIMNIMLVSVSERTREIGIRKAIGAKKSDILMQFLVEAVTLTLIGGIIGIVLGVGVGLIAGSQLYAKAVIPVDWVFIGLSVCVLVGVIFGTYPAYKAANMDPIEALRYE